MNKQVKELADKLKRQGLSLSTIGGGHYVVTRGSEVVHDSYGPVTVASTPSDHRFMQNTMARLRRCGAVKESPLAAPEMQAKKLEGIHRRHDREHQATLEIRALLEPAVVKLGGWSNGRGPGVRVIDLAAAASRWLEDRNVVGFASEEYARVVFSKLKTGKTLSEHNRDLTLGFVRDLARRKDPVAWFNELLNGTAVAPEPEPPLEKEPDTTKVTLAMRAFYWMARGSDSPDQVMGIVQEIQALERRTA